MIIAESGVWHSCSRKSQHFQIEKSHFRTRRFPAQEQPKISRKKKFMAVGEAIFLTGKGPFPSGKKLFLPGAAKFLMRNGSFPYGKNRNAVEILKFPRHLSNFHKQLYNSRGNYIIAAASGQIPTEKTNFLREMDRFPQEKDHFSLEIIPYLLILNDCY